jgi:hypothetical protein
MLPSENTGADRSASMPPVIPLVRGVCLLRRPFRGASWAP